MIAEVTIVNAVPDADRTEPNLKLNVKKVTVQELGHHEVSDNMPSIEIDAKDTAHFKSHKQIIKFYAFLGKFFGAVVRMDWEPSRYILYWITHFFLSLTVFHIIYTMIVYYCMNGDYKSVTRPLAISGLTISCALKWHGFLKHWKKTYSLLFVPGKLCLENIRGPAADIIATGLNRTSAILKTFSVGVLALLCFYVAVPIKFFFVDGMLVPLLPLEIIFVDMSTMSGFLTGTLIHSLLGLYSLAATLMYGSGFLICICNYTFLVDLIRHDFKELDEMWNGSNDTSVAFRYAFLTNIGKKLQDMKSYLQVVKDIYQLKFFIYFCGNYFGQVICLYEITEHDWIAGYTCLLLLFMEMMFYCSVGTKISVMDDHLCDIIYCSNWYTYDIKSKRAIQMLLHDCQQSKEIKLRNLGPLSVATGLQVLKSIYTYYTVMTELM